MPIPMIFSFLGCSFEEGELIAIGYDRKAMKIARHEVRTSRKQKEINLKCDSAPVLKLTGVI